MTNPFEDFDTGGDSTVYEQLELAKALDEMDEDVTPWEADFLESLLQRLRDEKRPLTPKQLEVLLGMAERYGVDRGGA